MRSRAWLLFPPVDAIELGERIWALLVLELRMN
jgi:hypothetical protein